MRRILSWLFALSAAALAGSAAAQSTDPDWASLPDGDQISAVYPRLATDLHLNGYTLMHCKLNAEGVLRECAIVVEQPIGLGFGPAALSLSGSFRMKPAMDGSRPLGGGVVNIPVRFAFPDPSPAPAPAGLPTSPRALELARKLVLARQSGAQVLALSAMGEARQASWAQKGVSEETLTAARDAMDKALAGESAAYNELTARAYAAELTADEIAAYLDFSQGPGGQAQVRLDRELDRRMVWESWAHGFTITLMSQSRFCVDRDCKDDPGLEERVAAGANPSILSTTWTQRPPSWQMRAGAPMIARILQLSGSATLKCSVSRVGLLEDCAVLGESPAGVGFGPAALSLSSLYRMQPPEWDWSKSPKPTVVVTLRFPRVGAGSPPVETSAALPEPPPSRLALATDLAALLPIADWQSADTATALTELDKKPFPGVDAATRKAFYDALRATNGGAAALWRARMASVYAGLFTEPELRAMIAFERTPAAQAVRGKRNALFALGRAYSEDFSLRLSVLAGQIFCSKRDCSVLPRQR